MDRHIAPHRCKEMRASFSVFDIDRRFLYFAPGEGVQRDADLFICVVLRHFQDLKRVVTCQQYRVHEGHNGFQRGSVQNSEFLHPLVEILTHGRIADAGIQIAGLESLHLIKALLWRLGTDSVEQLVEVHISQRSCDPAVLASSHKRPPGKVSAQKMQIQIMIGREVARELAVPGGVVLIVLHELALTVEVAAFHLEGTGTVLIELHHFKDLARNVRIGPSDPLSLDAGRLIAVELYFAAAIDKPVLFKCTTSAASMVRACICAIRTAV